MVKPLIFKPLKITNKKGSEKIYLPARVNSAAKISEKYTAIFLIVVAIFFELVRANQLKKR